MKPLALILILMILVLNDGAAMPGDAVFAQLERLNSWAIYVQADALISRLYPGNHFYIEGRRLQAAFAKNPSETNAAALEVFRAQLEAKMK